MKIKTADLIDAPLDWAVAKALGNQVQIMHGVCYRWIGYCQQDVFKPSTEGSEVIDIMEREKINVKWDRITWLAESRWVQDEERSYAYGPTLRIAVCRAFVAARLGDEVEVPDELMEQ